jgi:ABC-type transporter Mla subunit MlaD
MLLPVASNSSGLLSRSSNELKFVLPLSFGANKLFIAHIMIQHLQAAFFFGIAILMTGCVKQEDVDALVTAVKANRTDIKDLKGAMPEEDPNTVTTEELDAKFTSIAEATNTDIAGLQTNLGDLQDRFQDMGDNLAQAMGQIADKNTQINSLNQQVTSLGTAKAVAEKALHDQVRTSEIRAARMEQAADGLFNSVVVQQYREQKPGSTATNQALTLQIGDHYTKEGRFDQLLQLDPTFGDKYQQARTLAKIGQ